LRWVPRRERGRTAACENAKRLATIAKEEESILGRGVERCTGEVKRKGRREEWRKEKNPRRSGADEKKKLTGTWLKFEFDG